jgi:F-type H+-transporting ATPase subunit epsilon
MTDFTLHLLSLAQYEKIEHVDSFIGEDASGSFGIRTGHARAMTILGFGLARFRVAGGNWEYLAVPEALLYFADGQLSISTRRYLRNRDYTAISNELQRGLMDEEKELRKLKGSIRQMEEEMFRRLWKMGTEPGMIE